MKKIIYLVFILFTINLSAQEEKHLEFKGYEIKGTVKVFADNLVQKEQWKILQATPEAAILKGNFLNKECDITLVGTSKDNLIYTIAVSLPKEKDWGILKGEYIKYKNALTKKYGNGKSSEYFSEPYKEGDGFEDTAVKLGKCTYMTTYKVANGSISIVIGDDLTINLLYEDKVNSEINNTESNEAISSDI